MHKKIKLIWDFRGAEAEAIAKHHAQHLAEYVEKNQKDGIETGFSKQSAMYSIAYLIVEEPDMLPYRDALKPHRGEFIDQ